MRENMSPKVATADKMDDPRGSEYGYFQVVVSGKIVVTKYNAAKKKVWSAKFDNLDDFNAWKEDCM